MASSYLRVTTTTDAAEPCEKIESALKAASLANGAVLRETIQSFYWWDGAVQDDGESTHRNRALSPIAC